MKQKYAVDEVAALISRSRRYVSQLVTLGQLEYIDAPPRGRPNPARNDGTVSGRSLDEYLRKMTDIHLIKPVNVTFFTEATVKKRVVALSRQQNRSFSSCLREAVDMWLENKENR